MSDELTEIGFCTLCQKIQLIERDIVELEQDVNGEVAEESKAYCAGCMQLIEGRSND